MKLVTRTVSPVLVITKTESPWRMEGREGVTYRLGMVYDGDMEKMKAVSKEVFDKAELNKHYLLEVTIDINNGSVREPKIEDIIFYSEKQNQPATGKQ